MTTDVDLRRARMMAQTEITVRDPWCAATLVVLGERIVRISPRQDDPRRMGWTFHNPHGQTSALMSEIYEQGERSLVPSMLLRSVYKQILAATDITDIPEKYRDTTDTP